MSHDESRLIHFINQLTANNIFHYPALTDFAEFEKYRGKMIYGDLSFTSCYLWAENMLYRIRITPDAVFVLGLGADRNIGVYVLFKEHAHLIEEDIRYLKKLFDQAHIPLMLECLSEADAARLLEMPFICEVSYDDDFSDYIYDNSEFAQVQGAQNKNKRHEYHRFEQCHPEAVFVRGAIDDEAARKDCRAVFEEWCRHHSCSECRFGCEKKAFERLSSIGMPDRHLLGMVYEKGQPLSFGFGEIISEEYVFFHMQKNAQPVDGLTYYLHCNMARQMHPQVKYINWGEDMGMEGIRRNKSKYHPIELRKKYSMLIR